MTQSEIEIKNITICEHFQLLVSVGLAGSVLARYRYELGMYEFQRFYNCALIFQLNIEEMFPRC